MGTDKRTTQNGYDLWELMSALQKDIRRGNEKQATFWAVELESFNPHLLWKRLRIIASEDIGPANNLMPILIDILHHQYQESQKANDGSKGIFLTHAVLALSCSDKSREVDELLRLTYPMVNLGKAFGEGLPQIPDYALDMHTWKGKQNGRGLEHFYQEGAKIYPDTGSKYREELIKFEQTNLAKAYWSRSKEKRLEAKEDEEIGLDKWS